MLHNLHVQNNVELLTRGGQFFSRNEPVLEIQFMVGRMLARNVDIFFDHIDAEHGRPRRGN